MNLGNRKYESIKNKNLFHDTLQLLESDSGANDDYRRGVVVAVVSMLMADGYNFNAAIVTMVQGLKNKHRPTMRFNLEILPEAWRDDFVKAWETTKKNN